MKPFTDADVQPVHGDYADGRLYVAREDLVEDLLPWQKAGLQQTASGYGSRLTMSSKISFNGKLYRLYCTCFSNCGTVWFKAKGKTYIIS